MGQMSQAKEYGVFPTTSSIAAAPDARRVLHFDLTRGSAPADDRFPRARPPPVGWRANPRRISISGRRSARNQVRRVSKAQRQRASPARSRPPQASSHQNAPASAPPAHLQQEFSQCRAAPSQRKAVVDHRWIVLQRHVDGDHSRAFRNLFHHIRGDVVDDAAVDVQVAVRDYRWIHAGAAGARENTLQDGPCGVNVHWRASNSLRQ